MSSLSSPSPVASSSTSHLTPREKMRLAKVCLMLDEDQEIEDEAERRRSRRSSVLSDQDLSPRSSLSVTPPAGSVRGRLPKASILRRTSSSLESPSPPPNLPLPALPTSPSPTFQPLHLSYGPPRAMQRRSSRVRFSDQELGPTPDGCPSPIRRESTSALEGLREDIAKTQRSLSLAFERRASSGSTISNLSDPFGFSSSPLGKSSLSLNEEAEEEEYEAFKPQRLPYPRLSRNISASSSSSCEGARSMSLVSETGSNTSSVLASPAKLRDTVNRPWLSSTKSYTSVTSLISSVTSVDDSQSSSLVLDTRSSTSSSVASPTRHSNAINRPSLLSIISTTSTTSFDSIQSPTFLRDIIKRSSLTQSLQSSQLSFAPSVRGSLLSITSTVLSDSIGIPTNGYASLLPSNVHLEANYIPKLNREAWIDEEIGLSPRSGPTPLLIQQTSLGSPVLPAENTPMTPFELERSPLDVAGERLPNVELIQEVPTSRLDSIDLLPLQMMKGHMRNESTLSAVMSFPIPPDRVTLEVSYHETAVPREITVMSTTAGTDVLVAGDAQLEICLDTPQQPVEAVMGYVSDGDDMEVPSSPKLRDAIQRFRMRRSTSKSIYGNASDEESDLELDEPVLQLALKSRVLSPNSKLFNRSPSSRPQNRRSLSANQTAVETGWSGSESEEDGYISAMRDITLRKLSGSTRPKPRRSFTHPTLTLTPSTTATPCTPRPTPPSRPLDRLSYLSDASLQTTSSLDTDILTPCPSSSSNSNINANAHNLITDEMRGFMQTARMKMDRQRSSSCASISDPGDYAWGRKASPPQTPTKGSFGLRGGVEGSGDGVQEGFYERLLSGLNGKGESDGRGKLPEPTRRVDGWGKIEVLLDGLWSSESDEGEEEGEHGGRRMTTPTPRFCGSPQKVVKTRPAAPELVVRGEMREVGGWLMDEREPEWSEGE